jgi:hypothetical protein
MNNTKTWEERFDEEFTTRPSVKHLKDFIQETLSTQRQEILREVEEWADKEEERYAKLADKFNDQRVADGYAPTPKEELASYLILRDLKAKISSLTQEQAKEK